MAALLLLGAGLSAATVTAAMRGALGNCHSSLPEYLYAAYASQQGNLDYLLFDGDSLTKGLGATLGYQFAGSACAAFGEAGFFANIGILRVAACRDEREGQQRAAAFPFVSTASDSDWDGGSNDLHIGMTGVRLFHDFFLPYAAARRAEGFEIIAGTLIYRDDITPASNAERESYNNLLRANASTYGYAVADYDSIPQLRKPQTPGYSSDGKHPMTRAYGLMAAKLAPVVNGILQTGDQSRPN